MVRENEFEAARGIPGKSALSDCSSSERSGSDYAPAPSTVLTGWRERPLRLAWFGLWLAIVAILASHHVMWRDEVRALSFALQGDTVVAMLKGIHGEGHPALWYLLLRGAHTLVATPLVLPFVAFVVAAAAMLLMTLRSPFPPLLFVLLLFGAFSIYEYAVMARNYGISMLLLFALADRYPHCRDRGVLLGVLLALLCNTNVHSVGLAAGFLLFWLVEVLLEQGVAWTRASRSLLINAAIAAVGVVACILVVYPPFNDAAVETTHFGSITEAVFHAIKHLGARFAMLGTGGIPGPELPQSLFAIILVGSVLGLVRSPAAFLAALFAIVFFLLLFTFVYPGDYRHQALILVFLATLYWLEMNGRGGKWPRGFALARRFGPVVARIGMASFLLLAFLQWQGSFVRIAAMLHNLPESRSRDLGHLLARPDLQTAIVIGSPDYLLEPLAYYVPNPVYLVRERRFGRVVAFTRLARRDVTLGAVLSAARTLHAKTGRPIVIVLHDPVTLDAQSHTRDDGYSGTFTVDQDQSRDFLNATQRLEVFGPATTNESYTAYLLKLDHQEQLYRPLPPVGT